MDMTEPKDKELTSELIEPTVEPTGDKVYRLAAAVAAAASVVDYGATNALFQTFIKSPTERRTRQAIQLIMEAVNEIKERVKRTEEQLQDNEAFVSTIATAYSMASRTAEPEKLSAIKRSVVSSALESAPEEAVQQMYLSTLAGMTSIHLRLLPYFKTLSYFKVKSFNTSHHRVQESYFEHVMPFVPENTPRAFIERATRDLQAWGVIAIPAGAPQTMSGPNFITMMLTDFGNGLVEFIEA
jgi:hypothetical protein